MRTASQQGVKTCREATTLVANGSKDSCEPFYKTLVFQSVGTAIARGSYKIFNQTNFDYKMEHNMKLNKKLNKKLSAALLASALAAPQFVSADTTVVSGDVAQTGGAGAAVDLNFRITIPDFIFFRVGAAASVDQIDFAPTATEVHTAVAGIAGTGGDQTGGVVTVKLISNAGAVDIESSTTGATGLVSGADTISYAQINTADSGGGGIAPPALADNSVNSQSIGTTSGSVTNRSSEWTYTYDNPAAPPASGVYTGSAAFM
jgi:hypothetical protein